MILTRRLPVIALGILAFSVPCLAQSGSAAPTPWASAPIGAQLSGPTDAQAADWQGVIDQQVQAFRDGDADAALADAADFFRSIYPNAKTFFIALILGGGYGPISASQSDSFGDYQILGPDSVLQRVIFVGKDQTVVNAIFHMGLENGGWRVEALDLVRSGGLVV